MVGHLVTIIIPIYDVEEYLDECIQSVINQTYKNIEIIAINDGSTDNSLDIIEKYRIKDNRIKLISWKNKGLGDCRNEGTRLANGKYIFFIDSDDYINKHTINTLVKNISDSNSEVIVYNGIAFDNYDNEIRFHKKKYFNISDELNEKSLSGVEFARYGIGCMQACIKMYNKEFIQKNKILFTEGKYGEDIEFWFKCCMMAKSIKYINFIGYYRRYRPNSIMTGGDIRNISDRIENLKILKELILSIEEENRDIFIEYFSSYVLGLYYQILRRDKKEFRKLFKLFMEHKGMECIKLANLRPKSKLKKNVYRLSMGFRILLNV